MTLDFTGAVITHDTLGIGLDMRGGTLRLVTRPGVVVDTDSLAIGYAKIRSRPAEEPGAPVVLRVEIRGRMSHGQVVTGPPRRRFLRKGTAA
ncbi:hypothetical protein [Streptomyces sp. NPDC054834]